MIDILLTRFWNKVINPGNWDINKCWLWNGELDKDGYGKFKIKGKRFGAHRWIYEQCIKPILENSLVCHSCNVRNCVNPTHLYTGTHKQNMEYKSDCNNCADTKITNNELIEIFKKIEDNTYTSLKQIAIEYNITTDAIYKILNGKERRNLTKQLYTDSELKGIANKLIKRNINKGRQFSDSEILDIKERLSKCESGRSIAKIYNTDHQTIYNIRDNITHKDVILADKVS